MSGPEPTREARRLTRSGPAPVRWRVLGGVEVTVAGEPITLSPQSRYVLAVLLREPGRPVAGELLVKPSGSASTQQVVNAARVAVSRLRAALDPTGAASAVATSTAGYALDIDPTTVDHVAFAATLRAAEATEWPSESLRKYDAALALWTGPPFGELRSEPELHTPALALEEQHRVAVDRWCGLAVEAGVSPGVIGALESAVGDEPLRERRWEALMLAHYRAGNQGAAVRTYDRARAVLRDELGIEPGTGLQRLFTAVLEQDSSLEWRPARNVARPAGSAELTRPTVLVGRDTELEDVLEVLTRRRAVVVSGYAGIGKTTLAVEVAARFPGPAWIVPLAGIDDADRLHVAIATAMGLANHEPELPERVAAHLDDAGGLLVLDGCEHLADSVAATIADLLSWAPSGRVLATSRIELDVAGGFVLPLGPLPTGSAASPGPAAVIAADAALVRPSDIASRWEAIEEICRRADGVPLALELVGAASADAEPEPHDETSPLETSPLESAVQVGLASLPPDSRHMVDVLRILPGEVGVAFLGELLDIGARAVQRTLGPAIRAGLVVPRAGASGVRVRLLEAVRDGLVVVPEMAAVLVKDLCRTVRALAVEAEPSLTGPVDAAVSATLDDEHELGLWLLDRLEGDDRLDLACVLVPVWRTCGRHLDGGRVLDRLQPEADAAAEHSRAIYWVRRAQMSPSLASRAELLDELASARAIADAHGDPELAARAGAELAVGLGWAGQVQEAATLIADVRASLPEGSDWARLTLDSLVSMSRGLLGDPARAASDLLALSHRYREVGHAGEVANCLYVAAGMARLAADDGLLERVLDEAGSLAIDRFSAFPMAELAFERARRAVATGDPSAGPLLWEAYGLLATHGEHRTAAICRRELGAWRLAHEDAGGVSDLAAAALSLLHRDPGSAAVAIARIIDARDAVSDGADLRRFVASMRELVGRNVGPPLDAAELTEIERHRDAESGEHDPEWLVEALGRLSSGSGDPAVMPR